MNHSAFLRGSLATVGIVLDPPTPSLARRDPDPAAEVDRAEIYEILLRAGAPERHLRWMVDSCPSCADALTYRREHSG